MDDALWGVDPASFGGEAGIGAHGAEDDAAGYLHGVNLLDDGIKDGVGILAAAGSEAGGVGVAVDRGVVSQAVFAHDLAGVTPDEEVGFDFFAARVAADATLTGVKKSGVRWTLRRPTTWSMFMSLHRGLVISARPMLTEL